MLCVQALLNPTELIKPRCKFSGTTPELRTTKHMYLDLPELAPKLEEYVTTTSQAGGWSSNCVATTNSWLNKGLQHRAITRDLIWGTPVPRDGYDNKVPVSCYLHQLRSSSRLRAGSVLR